MRGHVRKHGKGWQWIVHIDGRQLSKAGFTTERRVDLRADRLVALDAGTYIDPNKLTVRAYLEETWLPAISGTVEETTFSNYTNLMAHVTEHLGTVRLPEVKAQAPVRPAHDLKDAGYSPNTIRRLHAVVHHALKDAERWSWSPVTSPSS